MYQSNLSEQCGEENHPDYTKCDFKMEHSKAQPKLRAGNSGSSTKKARSLDLG